MARLRKIEKYERAAKMASKFFLLTFPLAQERIREVKGLYNNLVN